VYRNLVDLLSDGSADILLYNNSAESTLPVTNLQVYQPADVFRTSAAPHADFRIAVLLDSVNSTAYEIDTAWLGYTNITPHLNLLPNGSKFTSWTKTNVDPDVASAPPALIAEFESSEVEATGAGSVKHNLAQTWTTWAATTNNATIVDLTASVYLAEATADAIDKVRLAIVNAGSSDEIAVDIDLADGSLTSVAVTGTDFPTSDATATPFTPLFTSGDVHSSIATGYRLELHADVAAGGDLNDIRVEIRMLKAGSETFTHSSEVFFASAAQLEIGTTATDPTSNTTDVGSLITIANTRNASADSTLSFAHQPRRLVDWRNDFGWVHAPVKVWSTPVAAQYVVFRIRDTGNSDGYFEAGRMVIGKSFQPSGKLLTDGISGALSQTSRTYEGGRRVFDLEFEYLDATTAERDFLSMYQYVKKREGFEVESAGGQRYAPDNRPILCILDDAAGESEPERIIYGTLEGQPVVSQFGTKFRTSIRIKELPK